MLDRNVKCFRVWKDERGVKPDLVCGSHKEGAWMVYSEPLNPVTGLTRFYLSIPPVTGEWVKEVWSWRCPSAKGASDGFHLRDIGK